MSCTERFPRRPDRRLHGSPSAHRTGAAAIDHIPFAGQPDRAGDRRAGRRHRHPGASAAEDGFDRGHEMPGREIGAGAAHLYSANRGPGAGRQRGGHRARQPGADGVSVLPLALLSGLLGAALRCGIGAAGAGGGGADGASVHHSAAAGNSLYPAGADLPARNGRAADLAARVVEAGGWLGDLGAGDPRRLSARSRRG